MADLTPIPAEGDQRFDAIVDALIGAFHFPEDHACRVTNVVLGALVEGVERTPTPAGRLKRAIVLLTAARGEAMTHELHGQIVAFLDGNEESAPSPSGITDEQVEAAHAELLRRPDRLLAPGDVRRALTAALEHQGGERTPDQISLAAVLALIDAKTPDGNPDDGPPAVQGSVARKLDLLRQGIVGLAEVERVGGERTHTPVPNEMLELYAKAADFMASESGPEHREGRCSAYLYEAGRVARAAARGDRSVRWPGDDTAGQEAPSDG